jgi:NitT/TauT family transport system substrate-binding protein
VDDLIVFEAKKVLQVPTNVFATTDEILDKRREVLVKFIRAHRRGTEFMHANPEKAAEIAAKYIIGSKDDKERNLAIVKLRMAMQIDDASREHGFGWLSEDVLNRFAETYRNWGLVKGTYSFNDFATNDLLKSLNR